MRFLRSRYILQNYRELQRRYQELVEPDQVTEHQSRLKRNIHTFDIMPSRYHQFIFPHHKHIVHRRVSRNLNNFIQRQLRRPFKGNEAYDRYMEKIRKKYQKYVKNILGYNNMQNYSSEIGGHPFDNTETLSRLENRENRNDRNYPFDDNFGGEHNENQHDQFQIVNNNFVSNQNIRNDIDYSVKPNMSHLIDKLKSQIIRKKRNAESNTKNEKNSRKFGKRANSNHTTPFDAPEIDENLEGLKRGKAKGPCEVSVYVY